MRDLVARVGGDDVAGRSRIHDVFSSERLPTWGLVQILVEALVRTIPDADPRAEERRLHQLWLAASGQAVVDTSTASASRHAEPPREVTRQERVGRRQLVMRVEWTTPTDLNATLRRSIRDHVSLALKDIGQQPQGRHRVDSSAGTTIVLQRRHEPPGLTAATFLSTLEEEFLQSTWPEFNPFDDNIGSSTIRFLAHYDEAAPSSRDAVMDLNRIWLALGELAPLHRDGEFQYVEAAVQGIDRATGSTHFRGNWQRVLFPPLSPAAGYEGFWLRTSKAPVDRNAPWVAF
ncbi:hypothetical protein [Streptomyces mirabilis]|uniref:hypothetical protein n=1 Tax=Streptomyces mirabilis TaxID=68239 RepID=UPI0036ACF550